MTHDLFKSFADVNEIKIQEIFISSLSEGVFKSEIINEKNGKTKEVDARPSDAIGIALRCNAKIYTTEAILEEAGIIIEDEHEEDIEFDIDINEIEAELEIKELNICELSNKELQSLLNQAIENEQYEEAAKLRDELDKRVKGS